MYKSFEEMTVWKDSKSLAVKIWDLTRSFPKEDTYTLISQLRNAALSISANIAEGFGRHHNADKARFYLNARGSLYETLSHMNLAADLGRISQENYKELRTVVERIAKELNRLINRIRGRK